MIGFVSEIFKNTVEKGENAGYQHSLLFPQCFQKAFSSGLEKDRIVGLLRFNPFPSKPLFLGACNESLLKTLWEKETLLIPQCFRPIQRTFHNFHQIQYCHLQTLSVWENIRLFVWDRVKHAQNGPKSKSF